MSTLSLSFDFSDIERQAKTLGDYDELIAREVLNTMQQSLDLFETAVAMRTPVFNGLLRGSIGNTIFGDSPDIVGVVSSSLIYAPAVEFGRRPGKMPPVSAIEYWVVRKGITGTYTRRRKDGSTVTEPLSSRALAFLIARAIGRRGTQGAHMFAEGFVAERGSVLALWSDMIDRVVDQLEVH